MDCHWLQYKQYEEQYSTYVNRYGPGLVVYWFGFIDEIAARPTFQTKVGAGNALDAGVMILSDLPSACNIAVLPGLPLPVPQCTSVISALDAQ